MKKTEAEQMTSVPKYPIEKAEERFFAKTRHSRSAYTDALIKDRTSIRLRASTMFFISLKKMAEKEKARERKKQHKRMPLKRSFARNLFFSCICILLSPFYIIIAPFFDKSNHLVGIFKKPLADKIKLLYNSIGAKIVLFNRIYRENAVFAE